MTPETAPAAEPREGGPRMAAPTWRRGVAQTRAEVTMTLRRGESVLLTLGIPVLLLVFFSVVDVLPTETDDPVDFLAPGILSLAVLSTALVGLAIATGFERQYLVLKRLRATPLGRPALLGAKVLAIAAVEVVQVAILVPIALLLGWRPAGSPLLALAAVVIATIAFGGLGLALAGRFSGLTTLALANGLYLVLLLLGGMIVPLSRLPDPLRAVARLLPAAALSEALAGALSAAATVPGRSWAVLALWAVAGPVLAATTFRWD